MGRYDRGTFYEMKELTSPSYEPLVRITRCLHFDDVLENYQKNALVSQPIGNTKNYSIKRLKVLWFASTKESFDESNFYGNVSYVINWKDVLKKFGPYMYAIDQSTLAFKSFSRILLTDVRHPELTELDDEYLVHKNSPLKFDYFEYSHVDRCRCTKQFGDHELQIGIEETTRNQAGKWLFANCQEIANDHTDINIQDIYGNRKYESYKCYKFNTIQKKNCPYQFSKSNSDRILNTIVTKHKEKKRLSVTKTSIANSPLHDQTRLSSNDSSLDSSSITRNTLTRTQNYLTGTVTTTSGVLPRTVAAYPKEVAAYPREVTAYPRKVEASSKQVSAYPGLVSAYPREVEASPKQVSAYPKEVAAHAREVATTTRKIATTPMNVVTYPRKVASASVLPRTTAELSYTFHPRSITSPAKIQSANIAALHSLSNPTGKPIDKSYNAMWNFLSCTKNPSGGLKLENENRKSTSNNKFSSEIPKQKASSYLYTFSQLSNDLRTTYMPIDLRPYDKFLS